VYGWAEVYDPDSRDSLEVHSLHPHPVLFLPESLVARNVTRMIYEVVLGTEVHLHVMEWDI